MARFCSLFSSSSANSTYIGTPDSGILVDAGASAKKITEQCDKNGIDIDTIKAIFVTHEHIDHVKGLRVMAEKINVPVYATVETLEALEDKNMLSPKMNVIPIDEKGVEIDGMEILPFTTPHDSAHSVGYTVDMPDERKIAVCTDLGTVTERIFNAIKGSDLILLESNHDLNMLRNGPYPYTLKQRIMSNYGHLSNESCADLSTKLIESGTTRFVLAHLSKQNNLPTIAHNVTETALNNIGARDCIDYRLFVAGDDNELIRL